ncbi:prepilin-type N-terminal cleavage/methylation domain-containing protein [Gemelliphila palaticanis]|uniref:Prepilin-type N-terminal cleavage/methylation domain-containing protein n=1 Tax=Gemelliphila palaticanis TaxID=81950 RepID=A0ABX2T0R5_9BACL|nr:prepilin-type N-terminal cleavage/methylation domain-containing protein [Gemella palaticanis]MBF0715303.1 prepilin-type N-terminal cleavage/methylation domain-containing protein [Gemella palaticanis]NYS47233.1 prepilin-type N-terminal cleavage/methylation domain-containing protein [Gemella palaticanis]
MEKHLYKNNNGFSFLEVIGVLFIICIVIGILSFNPISSYERYKERLAVNEIVSDIYLIQTNSTSSNSSSFIQFFEDSNSYRIYFNNQSMEKKIKENGVTGTGSRDLKFRYNKGNVNISNTVLVNFKNSSYEIIIHLETGYVTLNER